MALEHRLGEKSHGAHVTVEPPLLVDGLVAPQQALDGVVLVAGVALELPPAVHLRDVALQEPVVEEYSKCQPV